MLSEFDLWNLWSGFILDGFLNYLSSSTTSVGVFPYRIRLKNSFGQHMILFFRNYELSMVWSKGLFHRCFVGHRLGEKSCFVAQIWKPVLDLRDIRNRILGHSETHRTFASEYRQFNFALVCFCCSKARHIFKQVFRLV